MGGSRTDRRNACCVRGFAAINAIAIGKKTTAKAPQESRK
nr:MAG TPA: hypothetical protein [Caudoviricetes sp.]